MYETKREEELGTPLTCTCRGCGCQACGGLLWLSLRDAIHWGMITKKEAIAKGYLSPENYQKSEE